MKNKIILVLALVGAINSPPGTAFAQGTAFMYQGQLNDGTNRANGSYDFTFTLFDAANAGTQQGSPLTNSTTAVDNGLFTVTLDFGSQFPGANRWLEIAVRTNGANAFTTLAQRQQIIPTPYAITAGSVASGGLPAGTYSSAVTFDNANNSFSGAFSGDGTGLNNVNAYTVDGLTSASFWNLAGNTGANPTNGAFLGTSDNLPLEFKVNGYRALRLEYALDNGLGIVAPNLIGGASVNVVSNGIFGALIAGGGSPNHPNVVGGNYAAVLGGVDNAANGNVSVAMGGFNTASGVYSTAMGNNTTASGEAATAMGQNDTASGRASTALGSYNHAQGPASTVMGVSSTANGDNSTAMGDTAVTYGIDAMAMGYHVLADGDYTMAAGFYSEAFYSGSFVWADASSATTFGDIRANQFLIRASGGVGIGTTSPPPGGLNVASGGLAVTGASSPVYYGAKGVFIESQGSYGAIYGYDYGGGNSLPLCLNTPGGNVGIGLTVPAYKLDVNGSINAHGTVYANGVALTSDRNAKENFTAVNPREVLAKVANLPLTQWNYKADHREVRHLGPMAQDFQSAFALNGGDDKHISVVDEGGVALAAIQGLNQKLQEELSRQSAENARLQARLDRLEQLLTEKLGPAR